TPQTYTHTNTHREQSSADCHINRSVYNHRMSLHTTSQTRLISSFRLRPGTFITVMADTLHPIPLHQRLVQSSLCLTTARITGLCASCILHPARATQPRDLHAVWSCLRLCIFPASA